MQTAFRNRNSRLDHLLDRRASEKLLAVGSQVETALAKLRQAGVQVEVVGSMSRGDFRLHSDVDFLITDKARLSETEIYNSISDHLKGAGFDLVFSDRLSPHTLALMRADAHLA